MSDLLARQRAIIGTAGEWAANDIPLGAGEIALVRNADGTLQARVGNGTTPFSASPLLAGALTTPGMDARYVRQAETVQTGGAGTANKWPRLGADGRLDASLLNLPAAIRYRGTANPTSAPPAAVPGDAFAAVPGGVVAASWGAPVAGQTAVQGDLLIMQDAGAWSLVPSVIDPADFVERPELAAVGGAAMVGADDGAAGSLWTTVQGFISRAASSVMAGLFKGDSATLTRWQKSDGTNVTVIDSLEAFTGYAGTMTKGAGRWKIGTLPGTDDDSAIAIARDVEGDTHSHAVRDESQVNGTVANNAYASFDAVATITGTGTPPALDHIRGFQARMQYARAGTLVEYNGFGSTGYVQAGQITALNHFAAYNLNISGGGTVGTQIAYWSVPLTGATTNVGVFVQNDSYILGGLALDGPLSGVTTIAASGQGVFGAGHFTGGNVAFSAGGAVGIYRNVGFSGYAAIESYLDAGGTVNGLCLNARGSVVLINCADPAATVVGLEVNEGIFPHVDNTFNIGKAGFRWGTIFAGTGAINTSDETQKTNIGAIPAKWLDAWGDVEWSRYKMKGGKRWHVGLIAQRVHAAFAARDLDAFEIGLCCRDAWERETAPKMVEVEKQRMVKATRPIHYEEDGKQLVRFEETEEPETYTDYEPSGEERLIREAGEAWGLRYDECLAMEAAWTRREIATLKGAAA